MLLDHGGNITKIVNYYKIPKKRIIDFSSNINPLGINYRIKEIITKSTYLISQYPDPECLSAKKALANYLEINIDNILIGNGSNELIHIIPRALNCSSALIYQPTFSEYELSIKLAGAKLYFLKAKEEDGFCIDIKKLTQYIPKVDLVILCNPNNPTGCLLKKDTLLGLAKLCLKFKTYLLIDEVFMEFVEGQNKYSLIKEVVKNKHLLILRSLTKFFSLAGLRVGCLIADKELIKKISLFQPTWSVNALAQETVAKGLTDLNFIKKTKDYIIKERQFLFNNLKKNEKIYPYYPTANFILCKIWDKKITVRALSLGLIKSGIVIRDCGNFKGLNNYFFRVAIRDRKDNNYLIRCLKKFFNEN